MKKHFFINKKHNDDRIVLMYGVFPYSTHDKPLYERTPITFVSTYQEAMLAIGRLTYVRYYTHYKMWCDIRGKEVGEDKPSWQEYMQTCLVSEQNEEDQYSILELYYHTSEIVSFFRSFVECDPLGLPYENLQEIIDSIKESTRNNPKSMKEHVVTLSSWLDELYRACPDAKDRIDTAIEVAKDQLWKNKDTDEDADA